ncbi:TIGR03986 family CRISPR-associated RAMP protein [Marinomonas spartinae]|uniref:TIGR03986 family type III CRISPR-associated RAMP protein n=1 Tax=Marinomonas spartinae TaxID=1792290 RepID=UPI0018F21CA5|nr:TIGR03986 family CRISPR-associated RAMP protein [Marinomonas spartinae]MBJ7556669.1 TIGR03986 family CRISPR-associated RAMP protein [Marinomonas spartinae]
MSVFAPYNFVPLSRFIYLPHWADQVSHDVPFSDGISGTLTVELTCHTPTLVGGTQIPATKEAPGRVEFFKDPNGNPIIPGSSLKGMISSVMEIVSFARFNRLDDKRYSVRDLSSSKSFYLQQFPGTPKGGKSGWLKFNQQKGCWEITPCKMARIHQQDIIHYYNDISKSKWVSNTNSQAHQRYQLLNGIRQIKFDTKVHKTKGTVALPSTTGTLVGQLVVTGQPGQAFDAGRSAKKWEFVFYQPSDTPKPIPTAVIRDFLFIHSESEDWNYWKKKNSEHSETGIPVFFQEEGGKCTSIGLSYLYKLAYKNSTHEAVIHTNENHIKGDTPDLPELIFGRISNEKNVSLKGRVNIGTAKTVGKPVYKTDLPASILNGPKPTFYPAYIRQPKAGSDGQLNATGDYVTLMDQNSELSGWKRYPVKEKVHVLRPETTVGSRKDENYSVQVKLIPVDTATIFRFKLQLHNVREVELGALLWSLDFGEQKEVFHSLGMGKPFGLGRVSLNLIDADLHPVIDREFDNNTLLQKSRSSFIELMENAYRAVTQEHSWKESPQIKELLATSTIKSAYEGNYMPLGKFTKSKNTGDTLQPHSEEAFQPIEIDKNLSAKVNTELELLTDDAYFRLLQTQKEAERAQQEKEQKAQALAAQKANASPEERLIMTLKEMVDHYLDNNTSAARKKVNDAMNNTAKAIKETPFNEQQTQLCLTYIEPLRGAGMLPEPKFLNRLTKALEDQNEGG